MCPDSKKLPKVVLSLTFPERLPLYSLPGFWNGGGHIHLGLFDGVDELYPAGKEGDAAVRVGALGAVLEVSLDGAAHVGELAADLVMAAGEELHFHEVVALGALQIRVLELCLLGLSPGTLGDEGLVELLVAREPVREEGGLRGRCTAPRQGDSPLTSSVHGISQARILEQVAISSTRGSS